MPDLLFLCQRPDSLTPLNRGQAHNRL